ncbi:MAG TPA: hypothetical protein VHM48_11580 [Candidatus Limnocylindrales bacterium]|nr:hypothetical protein [Candidatus Limnocylindrales bacterium]
MSVPAAAPEPGERQATPGTERPAPVPRREVRQRSWLEIRWRQFRNAPRPVVRAVLSSLVVAIILGLGYLAYDVALRHGAVLPGGDLRTLYLALDIVTVLVVGSVVTWLVVPQPRGSGLSTTRSPWSAALGFFAAVPVCYLVLVVVAQVLAPLIG